MKTCETNKIKLFEYIKKYLQNNGFPPSVREMCEHVGVTSTSTIKYYLDQLTKQGMIKKCKAKSRAIEIVQTSDEEIYPHQQRVPLVGLVTAGKPILAEENFVTSYKFSDNLFKGDDLFMLNVKGDSMLDAGIMPGDIVVVNKQSTAENGDTVVAMIDGSATVKDFYKERDAIRLQPRNNEYQPIISRDIEILGKVVGVVRIY